MHFRQIKQWAHLHPKYRLWGALKECKYLFCDLWLIQRCKVWFATDQTSDCLKRFVIIPVTGSAFLNASARSCVAARWAAHASLPGSCSQLHVYLLLHLHPHGPDQVVCPVWIWEDPLPASYRLRCASNHRHHRLYPSRAFSLQDVYNLGTANTHREHAVSEVLL